MRNLFIRFCRFALGIIAAMTGVALWGNKLYEV